jgi:hypothetical protein
MEQTTAYPLGSTQFSSHKSSLNPKADSFTLVLIWNCPIRPATQLNLLRLFMAYGAVVSVKFIFTSTRYAKHTAAFVYLRNAELIDSESSVLLDLSM